MATAGRRFLEDTSPRHRLAAAFDIVIAGETDIHPTLRSLTEAMTVHGSMPPWSESLHLAGPP